jgi:hypothetical protein
MLSLVGAAAGALPLVDGGDDGGAHQLAVAVALSEHLIGPGTGHGAGLAAMAIDEQTDDAPNLDVDDHGLAPVPVSPKPFRRAGNSRPEGVRASMPRIISRGAIGQE